MSIAARLLEAQKKITGIAKTGTNAHFKYSFFEEREVLKVSREALNDAGLAFFYSVESVSDREVETRSGNAELLTDVFLLCSILDGDSGERLDGKAIGRGQDGQDKGINKAIVAGVKYWLLKVLMIPTDDDTEKDEHTNKEGNARTAPTPQRTPSARDGFSLDEVAGSATSKAKGRTYRELLQTDEGRGFIKWQLDKVTTLSPQKRTALTEALAPQKADAVHAVLLQDAVNRAASAGAITDEQERRVLDTIEKGDPDAMRIATDWLRTQMARLEGEKAGV